MRLKCEAVSGNNKKQGVIRNRTKSRNNNSNWFLLVSLTYAIPKGPTKYGHCRHLFLFGYYD